LRTTIGSALFGAGRRLAFQNRTPAPPFARAPLFTVAPGCAALAGDALIATFRQSRTWIATFAAAAVLLGGIAAALARRLPDGGPAWAVALLGLGAAALAFVALYAGSMRCRIRAGGGTVSALQTQLFAAHAGFARPLADYVGIGACERDYTIVARGVTFTRRRHVAYLAHPEAAFCVPLRFGRTPAPAEFLAAAAATLGLPLLDA
jgi:hypothetical protein